MLPNATPSQYGEIYLANVLIVLDCSGALWLPQAQTLVFSDLHFEKGSSFGRKGLFLPPYDTRRTLKDMARVIAQFQPQTIISLGDAFHDLDAEHRMNEADAKMLESFTQSHHWIWILGNHDPKPPKRFGGEAAEEFVIGGLQFSHEPETDTPWQVVGHMHPAAKVNRTGRHIRRRCFLTDGEKMIMPSFGAYTGGLNILDKAYDPYFSQKPDVWMLGEKRVFNVPRNALLKDGTNMSYKAKR